MRWTVKGVWILFAAGLALLFCGCAGTAAEGSPAVDAAEDEVTITASFRQENGQALSGGSVRFSFGGDGVDLDCPLSGSGELTASGLPKTGRVTLTVLDRQQEIRGSMVLSFVKGAVIDAATDESGNGRVTLREDTRSVALAFTVDAGGALRCSLRLAGQDPRYIDSLQEDNQCER